MKLNTDYTFKCSNNVKLGNATVTITVNGNYIGTIKMPFNIIPKPITMVGVTARRKGLTAKWKKQVAQTNGYQIQYTLNRKFTASLKIVNINKNTTLYTKVKKLKANFHING